MACGSCGRRREQQRKAREAKKKEQQEKGSPTKFVLQLPNGKTKTFGSRLERDAAQVRYGGTIRV